MTVTVEASQVRRRARSHTSESDHDYSSLHPTKRVRNSSTNASMHVAVTGELQADPGFDPPHNPANCSRGARRLRVRITRNVSALNNNDPLFPEEGDGEVGEEQGQEEVEQEQEEVEQEQEKEEVEQEQEQEQARAQPTGSWRRRRSDNPKITCSDEAVTIIAELASAHCQSSIHDPLSWLQDIADHVQTPSVDDESLISVVVRCRGISSKDVRVNFLVMVNYMTLVCKCQRCVTRCSAQSLFAEMSWNCG
jgi:hypothetical protein